MTDVLSVGRDPDRAPRRPPPALLVTIAAMLGAGSVIGYAVTHRASSARRPAAAPAQSASPAPVAPADLLCGRVCDAPILRAKPGAGPPGLRLLVDSTPPAFLDAAGRQHPGPRIPLPSGEHIESLLPMGAGAVAFAQPNFVAEPPPLGKVYWLSARAPPRLIGHADGIVQGVGSTVWTITNTRPATHMETPDSYTLRELDSAGHELTRHTQPSTIQVLRATSAGLLATLSATTSDGSYFGKPVKVVLLNAALGSVERVISEGVFAVLDVTDTRVAWSDARRSVIGVYDLEPSTLQSIPIHPAYLVPDYGRFSPDQHSLVLGYSGTPPIANNPDTYGYLQVLDLRTGGTTDVSGLRMPPKLDAVLDWSLDGSTVILGVDDRNEARIALWRPGNRTLTVLPTTVAHSDYSSLTYVQL